MTASSTSRMRSTADSSVPISSTPRAFRPNAAATCRPRGRIAGQLTHSNSALDEDQADI